MLSAAAVLDASLAERLSRAAGFPNLVAHAYETIDVNRVFQAARSGPDDLRAFFTALASARD
jgi:uncharacterized protein YutE (UPF0331/DUF86 family)